MNAEGEAIEGERIAANQHVILRLTDMAKDG